MNLYKVSWKVMLNGQYNSGYEHRVIADSIEDIITKFKESKLEWVDEAHTTVEPTEENVTVEFIEIVRDRRVDFVIRGGKAI